MTNQTYLAHSKTKISTIQFKEK